jgi:hypothetical protein
VSGFLQRIAANVVAGRARLHPMGGSIFRDSDRGRDSEAWSVHEDVTTFTDAPRAEVWAHQIPSATAEQREAVREEPPLQRTAAPAIEPKRVYKPLITVEPVEIEFEAGAISRRQRESAAVTERESAPAKPGAFPADRPRRTERPDLAELPSPPPLVRSEVPAAPQRVPSEVPAPTARMGAKTEVSRPAQQQPSAFAARRSEPERDRPDEIQIHIGRVEVIAVSPAAPRPQAPPQRRSIDLEEYLSRSDGRRR